MMEGQSMLRQLGTTQNFSHSHQAVLSLCFDVLFKYIANVAMQFLLPQDGGVALML